MTEINYIEAIEQIKSAFLNRPELKLNFKLLKTPVNQIGFQDLFVIFSGENNRVGAISMPANKEIFMNYLERLKVESINWKFS